MSPTTASAAAEAHTAAASPTVRLHQPAMQMQRELTTSTP